MDWLNLNFFFCYILNWWPWLYIFSDFFYLQFIIIYTLYLIYYTNNLYFILFYLFLEFLYFGLFISVYNLELFTAFLWLTECVIVFVSILFLFYFNSYSNFSKFNIIFYSFKYFGIYFGFFLLSMNYIFNYEVELFIYFINYINLWDNYYESLSNLKMNDLFGLYLSYYYINSFEYILIGLLLLIASMVSVNLNKVNKSFKYNNYNDLLFLFDFFNDFINFLFLRKQNLIDQYISSVSSKYFRKKTKK